MRKTGFKNPGNQYEGTFYILVEKNGSSQKFRMYGSNSPFTEEEKIQIILEYGKLRNQLQVRQTFRLQLNVNPKNVLMVMGFRKSIITEDLIGLVKVLAEHIIYQQKTFSVSWISLTVRNFMFYSSSKQLKLYPYKPDRSGICSKKSLITE